MKAHTQQSALIFAIALLLAGTVMAQGNRGRNGRDNDQRSRYNHYYDSKHHERDDYRNRERNENDYRDRDDRNRNSPGKNEGYYNPVVRYRPAPPAYFHRGRQPSSYHVWIPGEYRWRNGDYNFHPGSWVVPPRRGVQYAPGYWQPARSGGYVWISGFWTNRGF